MPRDAAGTYTLPEAPFQPNTLAQSARVNHNFTDIAAAISDSYSVSLGQPQQGPLNMNGQPITNLGGDLSTTGTITGGAITATGAISGASLSTTGGITAATLSTTGNILTPGTVSAGTLSSTGAITGASLSTTGGITAATLGTSGAITAGGNISTPGTLIAQGGISTNGNLNVSGYIAAPYLGGGENGAGVLHCSGTTNLVSFRWGANGTSTTSLFYRIDAGVAEAAIVIASNVAGLALSNGFGGPTTIGLSVSGTDGTSYAFYCDLVSDARIKNNVVPTAVDALAALLAVEVSAFDVDAAALAAIDPGDAAARAGTLAAGDQHVPIGLVAQQVQATVPEMVTVVQQAPGHDPALPDDLHHLDHSAAVPYLIRAVQQMAERIAALEAPRAA
jgi:hypothetical protein